MDTDVILDLILELFNPVVDALDDPSVEVQLLRELGFELPEDVTLLGGVRAPLESLAGAISVFDELPADADSVEYIELLYHVVASVRSAIEALNDLADSVDPSTKRSDFVTTTNVMEVFPRRLLDYLVSRAIRCQFSSVHAALSFMGVIREEFVESEGSEYCVSFVERVIHWDRLLPIFSDFSALLEALYGWGTANVNVAPLLERLHELASAFGMEAEFDAADSRAIASFNAAIEDGSGEVEDSDDVEVLRIPFVPWMPSLLGCEIYPVRTSTGGVDGFGAGVYVEPGIDLTLPISDEVSLVITLSSEVQPGFGFVARAGRDIVFVTSVFQDEPGTLLQGPLEARATFDYKPLTGRIVVGAPEITHLEIESISTSVGAARHQSEMCEFYVEFGISRVALVVLAREGDNFLRKSLPEDALRIEFDVVLGLSNQRGIYIGGSAGLEYTFVINKGLGPVFVELVRAKLHADDEEAKLAIALTGGLDFGPLVATIQDIGLETRLQFDKPGFLGTADVSFGFKPPDGVGLSIDASGIVGGGFLKFDDANKRYTGVLTMNFGEIGLTAIGLITTKMPDGSEGFALLINIGATFNPPMQLSMGFTLSGVGGLIGVNRSMEIDVLRTGLKNRTLDSILFPEPSTVIANASKIISDLRTVFPPAEERYVVGPMVKIGWGSPTIITADIGIILEFPDPVRIVLLGQVEAALPEEKKALVVIHLDVLGVMDFAKGELTFQASLYDSRILSFTLFGDSAFLLGWGGDPRFALSLGGFHPKFTPPPPPIVFADLKRLTLDIGTGSKLQLACRAYLALTPNSLQFGARVDLYASAGGFTAEGHLGFDALFYLSPFSFEVEICGGVHLKYKGLSLFGINLTLLLSGPTPWHARGKAKISLLFFSIKVGFSITWGESEKVTLAPIDAWQPLQEALAAAGNWSSGLPTGRTLVESLRGFEEDAPGMIIVHPAGRLEVRQNVVPLGICLDKAGNAPITGHDLFDIKDLIVDDESLNPEPVQEFFARGQFEELTSDQKLSVPSFERMKGGVTTAASEMVRIDGEDDVVEYKPVTYESIIIKRDSTSELQQLDGEFEWEEAQFIAAAGITRKAIRRAGPRKRFSSLHPRPKVGVREDAYCIANAEDLTRATLSSELDHENRNMTRMAADQVLRAQIELEPEQANNLLVVPEYEVYEVIA